MVVKLIKIICDVRLNGYNVLCVFMTRYIEQVRVCVLGVSKVQSTIHEVVKEQVHLVSRFCGCGPRRTPLPSLSSLETLKLILRKG